MDSFAAPTPADADVPSTETLVASQSFVGRWDRLVSRTNWEKGRIIAEWREALLASAASPAESSDDTWSRLVGNVTPQHVGRLRRTYARFGALQETFAGLYWSHFYAALEWNDAELWLEGAVQNEWSVSRMRRERWEALGGAAVDEPPADAPLVESNVEDDAPLADGRTAEVRDPREFDASSGPAAEGPDFGDETEAAESAAEEVTAVDAATEAPTPAHRPFENLATLPPDLHEAFEAFKLAIVHHRISEWRDVAPGDVVAALRALEALVLAPA